MGKCITRLCTYLSDTMRSYDHGDIWRTLRYRGRSQCSVWPAALEHLLDMEGKFDGLFHLNYPRIAHLLHFLLFVGIFQMTHGQMSSFLLLISLHHPSFLCEMMGLLLVSLTGILPAMGKVI